MRIAATFFLVALLPAFAQRVPIPGDTESSLEQGVDAFREGKYLDAIAAFQKAVDFDPSDAMAHLYLGIAHTTQYIPGMHTPESNAHGQQARAEFLKALEIAPANKNAMQYLASLALREAQVLPDQTEKIRKLDEARSWYVKIVELDKSDKEAYYSIAMVDYMKLNPEMMNARAQSGMANGESGPLRDVQLRNTLKAKYLPVIEDGLSYLNKGLEVDPKSEPSMNYMQLLLRARADLRDTPEDYQADIKAADSWIQQAASLRTPPGTPQRIRLTQPPRLITKVEPAYPPLAKQAQIQGTVRFTIIIAKDGHIENMQLVSGHPLLIAAAQDALKKWVYEATVRNGQPVEVSTQVDVNFTLPAKNTNRDRACTRPRWRQEGFTYFA